MHSNQLLDRRDWDFSADAVPKADLIPCLMWEFLRESSFARKLTDDRIVWQRGNSSDAGQHKIWKKLQGMEIKFNYPRNFSEFIMFFVWGDFGENASYLHPWQSLHPRWRERLTKCTQPFRAAFVGSETHLLWLQDALKNATKELCPVNDPARSLINHSPGREVITIVVNWGFHDNEAIRKSLEYLAKDIANTRPLGVVPKSTTGSGKQSSRELRGMLNSLGMTRIYSRYDPQQLRAVEESLYKSLVKSLTDKGPTNLTKKLNAAKKRFEERFRELLPFESERPLCLKESRL